MAQAKTALVKAHKTGPLVSFRCFTVLSQTAWPLLVRLLSAKVWLMIRSRSRSVSSRGTFSPTAICRPTWMPRAKNVRRFSRLRVVPRPGRRPFYRFTLDDLDELAAYVAAEANHAKFKKLEKELRQLCGRVADVLEAYTDEPDRSAY